MSDLKAFRVSALGTKCIVFAEDRGQARRATVTGAKDAGYDCTYSDVSYARRAPEFDDKMGKLKPRFCYSEEFIGKRIR